ncbi:MAG: hypothetical protein M9938_11035 [Solirubrobacterales bacterium]|nr:hypothetical protein [Solirubrobacterales bacterium]
MSRVETGILGGFRSRLLALTIALFAGLGVFAASTTPASAGFITSGDIGAKYASLGGEKSFLGQPTGNEIVLSTGGSYQQFQNGRIYWKGGLGAWPVTGGVGNGYLSLGADKSFLGYPTGSEVKLSTGGWYQQFQNGRIYWKGGLGAWPVTGGIGGRYLSMGADKSSLGYPTGKEIRLSNGEIYQQFQKGRIYWKSGKGTWVVMPPPAAPPGGATTASLKAAAWAQARTTDLYGSTPSGYWSGYCLMFAQAAWDAAGKRITRYPTAKAAANAFRSRGKTTTPPRGAMVFWPNVYPPYGHVAIADGGAGVYSTMGDGGARRNAHVNRSYFGGGWFWVIP